MRESTPAKTIDGCYSGAASLDRSAEVDKFRYWLRELGFHIENTELGLLISSHRQQRKIIAIWLDGSSNDPETLRKLSVKRSEISCVAVVTSTCRLPPSDIVRCCESVIYWPQQSEQLRAKLTNLKIDPESSTQLLGHSIIFSKVMGRLARIAKCDAPVLIEGETGTGKEVVARSIHNQCNRSGFPFIAVNCGALPETLVENELFGHERGAFTGAQTNHKGLVTQADGGTLFLDEIEALPLKGKLRYCVFAGTGISATWKSPGLQGKCQGDSGKQSVIATDGRGGKFRQDLYFRINVFPINLPPLREREDDVLLLAEYFIERFSRSYNQPRKHFTSETLEWMQLNEWPGNVRELENWVHREFLLAEGDAIHMNSTESQSCPDADTPLNSLYDAQFNEAKNLAIQRFELQYLHRLMERANGNVSLAARLAGKERRALGKLLKKHCIDRACYNRN